MRGPMVGGIQRALDEDQKMELRAVGRDGS